MLRTCLLVLLAVPATVSRAAVPIVYADDQIEIGAAVLEAGVTAMHLGDELTLVVEATFDPDTVQVESLGADWFRRAFAELGAVTLNASDEPQTRKVGRGEAKLVARYHFQVVGCPPGLADCAGTKRYELPLVSLAYRLTSGTGAAAERSARFTPWPGRIDLAPAVVFEPAGSKAIADVIPGGAWPSPRPGPNATAADTVMIAAGVLLLGAGLVAGRRRRERPSLPGRHSLRDSRWQRAARELAEPALGDDAWSDQLRRCITWYCQDELGRNPVEWLRSGAATDDPAVVACRSLYLDVLAEEGIAPDRRESFRNRWAQVTSAQSTAGNGQVAR